MESPAAETRTRNPARTAMGLRTAALRAFFTAWLGAAALVPLLAIRGDLLAGGHAYRQGDWLINLAGGPVRRGLPGEAVLGMARATGADPVALICALQAALVLGLFALLIRAGRRLTDTGAALFLFAGPGCFVAFWAADPDGALRKETLLFTALALLLTAAQSPRRAGALAGGAAALYALACLWHEAMALWLPAMLAALALLTGQGALTRSAARRAGAVMLAGAAAGLGWALAFPATGTPHAQCAALMQLGARVELCHGSIDWTGSGAPRIAETFAYYLTPANAAHFALAAALALAPLAWLARHLGATRTALTGAAICLLPALPLYAVAVDWGRFLTISLTALACLAAIRLSRPGAETAHPPVPLVAVATSLAAALLLTPAHTIGWASFALDLP